MDWLHNPDSTLKKWRAQKIAEIHRKCENDKWFYIPTAHNVADLCSRGINPRKADSDCVYL